MAPKRSRGGRPAAGGGSQSPDGSNESFGRGGPGQREGPFPQPPSQSGTFQRPPSFGGTSPRPAQSVPSSGISPAYPSPRGRVEPYQPPGMSGPSRVAAPLPSSVPVRAIAASGQSVIAGSSSGGSSSGGTSSSPIISLSSSEISFASGSSTLRPGEGKKGKRVVLVANHLNVTIPDMSVRTIYHYDVAISPSITSKGVSRAILRDLVTKNQAELGGKPVYDGGKSLFCVNRLLGVHGERDFTVILADEANPAGAPLQGPPEGRSRERRFQVKIRQAAMYSMDALARYLTGRQQHMPQEIIQALDVALRERPTKELIPVGPSFFSERSIRTPLGGGVVVLKGFYQSLRATQRGPSLVVDVSSKAFYGEGNLADFIAEHLGKRLDSRAFLSDAECVKVKKVVMRLQVKVNHRQTPRKYKITGLSRERTRDIRFSLNEGPEISIIDYFRDTYNYDIKLVNMPCVAVGGKKNYLPIECCEIVMGQKYPAKLNENQVSAMLKQACTRPGQRLQDIQDLMNKNHYQSDPYAMEFGMHIEAQPVPFEGRVLDPPMLQYGNKKTVSPQRGAWNLLKGEKLVSGGRVENWAIVCFSPQNRVNFETLRRFGMGLVNKCNQLGIMMPDSPAVPPLWSDLGRYGDDLKRIVDRAKSQNQVLKLLIVVFPTRVPQYEDIKTLCDTQLDLPTQGCLEKHVLPAKDQYFANLALKINVKVGGSNVEIADQELLRGQLPFLSKEIPTLLLGADVTHPAPGNDWSPSVAAVVGNLDIPFNHQYRTVVKAQAHRQEIIQGLHDPAGEGILAKLLVNFYKINKRKPERIIYFRDGVSEGQFYQVLRAELEAMKAACRTLEAHYNPKFTVVVVQKRHHTRIFCKDQRDGDKSGNCMPGTVVDTAICHPREFDFYLFSHAGIQGTSRPTHYHVLHDENHFSADQIQLLANSMSYTYARCTRSVSVVPPVYYAHLAAVRGRFYLGASDSVGGGSETGSASGSQAGREASSRGGPAPVPLLPSALQTCSQGMYFC